MKLLVEILQRAKGAFDRRLPHLLSSEKQQIFKGFSIDAAVIAAVPYLHSRTTFHLISMTFIRQPPIPEQGWEERERQGGGERCALDNTSLTPHAIPNQIDLCWLPVGTPA